MTYMEPQPTRWKAMTALLIVVTAGYLGICLLLLLALAWQYSLMDDLGDHPAGYDRESFEALLSLEGTLGWVELLAIVATFVAYVAWWLTAWHAARPFGRSGAARHWTLIAWPVGIAVSWVAMIVVNVSVPTRFADFAELRHAALSLVRTAAINTGFRVAVTILLVIGVLTVARRLRELTAPPEFPMQWTFPMDVPPSQPAGVDVGDQNGPRPDVVERVHDPVHLGAEDHGLHGDPALPVERRDGW